MRAQFDRVLQFSKKYFHKISPQDSDTLSDERPRRKENEEEQK